MVQWNHPELSLRRQCELLGLNRSTLYSPRAATQSEENLELMRRIDEQYLVTPFYGSRRMGAWLRTEGHPVNRKRVQRLMRKMGIQALYPKPRSAAQRAEHEVFPYLLRDLPIQRANQVWSSDITYLPMRQGFMYLVAVLDWYSLYVLAWELSNTLDTSFCVAALQRALAQATPEIFNTDQGCQFTAKGFTQPLKEAGVSISMDGRGRALDNVFIERLWRTLKYEDIYLRDYQDVPELEAGLRAYFNFYNHERLHQALGYTTPASVHYASCAEPSKRNESSSRRAQDALTVEP